MFSQGKAQRMFLLCCHGSFPFQIENNSSCDNKIHFVHGLFLVENFAQD